MSMEEGGGSFELLSNSITSRNANNCSVTRLVDVVWENSVMMSAYTLPTAEEEIH